MVTEVCVEEMLLKCTQEVFETMIFMDMSDSYDPAIHNLDTEECFLGMITFKGNIEGCLSISCSSDCAKLITINMLGMEPDEPVGDEEIFDAIGEVCNMILGSMKASLQSLPLVIGISIPTVMKGCGIKQHLSEVSGQASVQTCLEDEHPLKVFLEWRLGIELEKDETFILG